MKKLFSVLLLSVLFLCSCSSDIPTEVDDNIIDINSDKISRRNNRVVLMDKYTYIQEHTEYFNLETDENIPNWSIEYNSNDETGACVQFIYGDQKQYFYNETIYAEFGDDQRIIIPFKSDFYTEVQKALKRENTLNYVYYRQHEGYKTDNGYAASYWFTVTSDVLDEFTYWDIHVGDTIKVDYNLNENFEIIDYTYYIVDDPYGTPVFTKIMTSTTTFNIPFKFPDFIYECDNSQRVALTVKENYKLPSEISETFYIPENMRIWGEEALIKSQAYKDDDFENGWDFEDDVVKEDITIYTFPSEDIE